MDPFQNGMDLDRLHALVISCYICLCHLALGDGEEAQEPTASSSREVKPGTVIREMCLPTN